MRGNNFGGAYAPNRFPGAPDLQKAGPASGQMPGGGNAYASYANGNGNAHVNGYGNINFNGNGNGNGNVSYANGNGNANANGNGNGNVNGYGNGRAHVGLPSIRAAGGEEMARRDKVPGKGDRQDKQRGLPDIRR